MLITRDQMFAGVPAEAIRGFLLKRGGRSFSLQRATEDLGMNEAKARKTLNELVRLGYLKRTGDRRLPYEATLLGGALANAKIGKGYSRKVAEKALAGFLERVAKLNADDRYSYWVEKAYLFGSMLTDKSIVSDVDVIIDLKPRFDDHEKQFELSQSRIRKAQRAGRSLSGMMYYAWPLIEVHRYLKAGSPVLSLHDADQMEVLKGTKFSELTWETEGE